MKKILLILLALTLLPVTGETGGISVSDGPGIIKKGEPESFRTAKFGDGVLSGDELKPMFAIRLDDSGRADHFDTVELALSYGLPIGSAFNWESANNDADAARIQELLTMAAQMGVTWEPLQHSNNNMDATFYGGSSANDYGVMSVQDWIDELDPAPIEAFFGEGSVKGFVIPGDPGRWEYVRYYPFLFQQLLETHGLEYGMDSDSYGAGAPGLWRADRNYPPSSSSEAAGTPNGAFRMPGQLWGVAQGLYGGQTHRLPIDGTWDLGERQVERWAGNDPSAPSWVPSTTTEWTYDKLASKGPDGANFTNYSNHRTSFREYYNKAIALNGGWMITLHSEATTNDQFCGATGSYTPTYPSGATAYTGDDCVDYEYIFATVRELADQGLIQLGTPTELMKWRASRIESGVVQGSDLRLIWPSYDIGDTKGYGSFWTTLHGTNGWNIGATNPYNWAVAGIPIQNIMRNATLHSQGKAPGYANDGRFNYLWYESEVAGYDTDNRARWLSGDGPGGTGPSFTMNYTWGGGSSFSYGIPSLQPGEYVFHMEMSNVDQIEINSATSTFEVQAHGYDVQWATGAGHSLTAQPAPSDYSTYKWRNTTDNNVNKIDLIPEFGTSFYIDDGGYYTFDTTSLAFFGLGSKVNGDNLVADYDTFSCRFVIPETPEQWSTYVAATHDPVDFWTYSVWLQMRIVSGANNDMRFSRVWVEKLAPNGTN